MSHTDPYRFSTGSAAGSATGAPAPAPAPELSREHVVRTLLWAMVVISAVANTAASVSGAGIWVHLACGAVTSFAGLTLAVRALRGRR